MLNSIVLTCVNQSVQFCHVKCKLCQPFKMYQQTLESLTQKEKIKIYPSFRSYILNSYLQLRPIIPEVELLVKEAFQLNDSDTYVFTNSGSHHVMGRSAPLALPYNIMQWLRKNLNIEMKHWSIHDLRKTMRTNMSELTEPHIAEIMLGHKLPGNWEVYDHHKYLKEQAAAYSKWWGKIVLVTGTRGTD